jgi:hypothetical protein
MRNHASSAHLSECEVNRQDIEGFALLLEKNLFSIELPDPRDAISGDLFEVIKNESMSSEKVDYYKAQISTAPPSEIENIFGFMLNFLCQGISPSYENVKKIFPTVWTNSTEKLKKTCGEKYRDIFLDPSLDKSGDKDAKNRIFYFLVEVKGVNYIPNYARSALYLQAAKKLAEAKDTSYGWSDEVVAAKTLHQIGTHIPKDVFEEVYQEIISVWCGNYWGRSSAHRYLTDFFDQLEEKEKVKIAKMFSENPRVREEMFNSKPRSFAIELLKKLKKTISIEANKSEVRKAIETLKNA